MEESILNFPKQFTHTLKTENSDRLIKANNFLVAGMGGSAFPAELLKIAHPELSLSVWKSYDLPTEISSSNPKTLIICSSYSGNTEETLSAFEKARKAKFNFAAVTAGGKLLSLAKKHKVPFIRIPDTKIQPRMATGFFVASYSKLINQKNEKVLASLSSELKPESLRKKGKALSENLWDQVPIIYSSIRNFAIAKIWKIKFNENAKIPAHANFFPELNHNEMTGFDIKKTTVLLSQNLHFILLEDTADHIRIKKRFKVTKNLLSKNSLNITSEEMKGKNTWVKIFTSILLADWASFYLAKYYGNDPEAVPMVEQFKKLLK